MGEDHGRGSEGALAELTAELDDLYVQAGRPSLRWISSQARGDDELEMLSHQTAADMLKGKGLPSWAKLRVLVVVLGRQSVQRPDPAVLERQFHRLWDAAWHLTAGTGLAPDPRLLDSPDGNVTDTSRHNGNAVACDPVLWRLGESLSGGVPRVRCVAVAADGSAMAVVANDRLQITDPQTRIPMSKAVKNKRLRHVALSPDGALLATFTHIFNDEDRDYELSVKETRTRGSHRGEMDVGEEIGSALQGLAFTADGRLLYLIHEWPSRGRRVRWLPSLRLMDPLTEECVGPPIAGPLDLSTRSVAISHDGTRAATADHTGVRVWHAPTGEVLDTLALESIGCLAFAPSGHLLCLGNDGTLLHTVAPTKT